MRCVTPYPTASLPHSLHFIIISHCVPVPLPHCVTVSLCHCVTQPPLPYQLVTSLTTLPQYLTVSHTTTHSPTLSPTPSLPHTLIYIYSITTGTSVLVQVCVRSDRLWHRSGHHDLLHLHALPAANHQEIHCSQSWCVLYT